MCQAKTLHSRLEARFALKAVIRGTLLQCLCCGVKSKLQSSVFRGPLLPSLPKSKKLACRYSVTDVH